MRLTYTDLKNQFLRNIGMQGSSDTTILADFNNRLAQRYQMVFANLHSYVTQTYKTQSTVAATQYYPYPVGVSRVDDVYITIGSVKYPLQIINSQHAWDVLNAIQLQPSAIPQFLFPRRSDYGIWPIPQDVYTITFNYFIRDRSLLVDDYTTGTVNLTNGDATVTATGSSGIVFTNAMVGRWIEMTDTTYPDYGLWYRIASCTDADNIELETPWQGSDVLARTYRIGQCPEIPEEGHIILADGVTADFYAGQRSDIEKATWFDNMFWTGQGNNDNRKIGDDTIKGGLIGMVNRYTDRDQSGLIRRQPKIFPPEFKIWATSIS